MATEPEKTQAKKWGDKFKEFQLTVFLEQVVRAYLPVAGAVGLVWGFLNYDLGMKKYESKSIRAEIDARLQAQRIEASQRRGWMVSLVADLEGKSKATMQKSAKCIDLLLGVFSDSTIPNFALVPLNPVGNEPIQWIYVVKILVVSSLASEKAKTEAREKCTCPKKEESPIPVVCKDQSDAVLGELRGQDKNVDQLDFWLQVDTAWVGYTANYLLTTDDEQPGYWISNAGFTFLDPPRAQK